MIKFEKVVIEGFGSIESMEFEFRPGLNIIKAENGVGKTTIFNAWYWCLTGDTLKPKCSINTWPHLQSLDYQGTKVEVFFKSNKDKYHITRCHDYSGKVEGGKGNNRLVIIENGELINLKGKAENQDYLINVLGYSPELLKNTLVFGQKLKRLIDETGTNKKEILEEAFEIMFINEAQDKAKRERQKKLSEYNPVNLEFHTMSTELKGKKELLTQAIESEKEFEFLKERGIAIIEKDISDLKRDLDLQQTINQKQDLQANKRQVFEKNSEIKRLSKSQDEYYEVMGEVARLEASLPPLQTIDKLTKEASRIERILSEPLKVCPTCKQDIKGDHKHNVKADYEKSLGDLKKKVEELQKTYDERKEKLSEKKTQLSSLKLVIANIDALKNQIKILERHEDSINNGFLLVQQYEDGLKKLNTKLEVAKLETIKRKSTKIKLEIKRIKAKLRPIKKLIKSFQKELEILDWLISDPLSNSGLKMFIFRDMIHLLNSKMADYAKYFGFKVEFDVNMESARKEIEAYIYHGEDIVAYQDLSGGQAQSVAVIMAFALHDIVAQGSKASNILLMDEIFENLSRTNIEKVTEIILKKLGNLSINLITHRNEFNPYNSRSLYLKSKDGKTLVETK